MKSAADLLVHARDGEYGLFINGRHCASSSGKLVASMDPTCDQPWYEIADANEKDIASSVIPKTSAGNGVASGMRPGSHLPDFERE